MPDRPTTSDLASRVARSAGDPGLPGRLARLTPSKLQPLLLHVFRSHAARVAAGGALAAAGRPLFAPSAADGRLLHRLDALAFREAEGFDALDPSPVVPLGATAALGGIDQNNVLSAIRSAEVVSDPTVPLALEAARRRRSGGARRGPPVRLCASHRCVRMQPVESVGFTPHFRLFTLVTAGRDAGEHRFEVGALKCERSWPFSPPPPADDAPAPARAAG